MSSWDGLRFVNVERHNLETLQTLARADAAQAGIYWPPGRLMPLLDGTFGLRNEMVFDRTDALEYVMHGRVCNFNLNPTAPLQPHYGFEVIDFGGVIIEVGPTSGRSQLSASLGSISYNGSFIFYNHRCFKPITNIDVWVRYRLADSAERDRI